MGTDLMPSQPFRARDGSILIIVVGLSALLLASYLVVASLVRTDAVDGQILMRDAQARIMLPSALGFILECARLGQTSGTECFGWTDVRDGGIGPRGPIRSDGSLPPPVGGSAWPALGSAYRGDLHVLERPPCAVQLTRAYNPVSTPSEWVRDYEMARDPSATLLQRILNPQQGAGSEIGVVPPNPAGSEGGSSEAPSSWYWTSSRDPQQILTNNGLATHWGKVWSAIFEPMDTFQPGYSQALSPQPVADTWSAHLAGDMRPRPQSVGQSWFRVRRLVPSHYDGNPSDAWFDTVPLAGYGVFLIACGAGGTRGYRDWAEVVADNATAIFLNEPEQFEALRERERILWFRCQWSGFVGGAADSILSYNSRVNIPPCRAGTLSNYWLQQDKYHYNTSAGRNRSIALLNTLGTISWIEKLEREPVDGGGTPLW